MANTGSHQPSHEAQVKGGEHSHSGSTNHEQESNKSSSSQSGHNAPSHEAQVKGGEHSHAGGNR